MKEKTDERIMNQVKAGELDKAAILFENYHVKMYNYFLRMTYNKTVSQDLTQNTFHRMLKYRKSFNDSMSFKNWIYRIAKNVFLDSLTETKVSFEKIENHISETELLETDKKEKERIEILAVAMQNLTTDEREIITMNRFQEIRQVEIAEILEISVSAVKVRVHRAMKKLKVHYFNLHNAEIYN